MFLFDSKPKGIHRVGCRTPTQGVCAPANRFQEEAEAGVGVGPGLGEGWAKWGRAAFFLVACGTWAIGRSRFRRKRPCRFSPNSVSTLRGSYGKRKGLGARLRCRLLSASVLCGMYRRFVLLLDVEVHFDCAGSHKVRCRLLSASVLRGMYRRFVLLLDVEVHFDCAGSHKVRCRLLSASVLRGLRRRFVLLLDVEMCFDCAGSHKVRCRLLSASVSRGLRRSVEMRFDCAGSQKVRCQLLSVSVSRGMYRRFLLLLDVEVRFDCAGSHNPGTVGVVSRGPAARVSGERSRARFPPCPRELVSLSLGMLGWCFCAATASRWQQQPNSNSNSNSNSATFIERKKYRDKTRTKEEATYLANSLKLRHAVETNAQILPFVVMLAQPWAQ